MREQRNGMEIIEEFKQYLLLEEKSKATIDKYTRDTTKFLKYIKNDSITNGLLNTKSSFKKTIVRVVLTPCLPL